jgi:hypothetical protein
MILIFLNIYFRGSTSVFFNTVETRDAAKAIDLFFIPLSIFNSFVEEAFVSWLGLYCACFGCFS